MRNIKLSIQYDGTNYNGWQIQPSEISDLRFEIANYKKKKDIITIQGIIQSTIKKITGEDAKVIAAGRTDTGVHAIEQIASFKTSSHLSADVIKRALNAVLPYDIRILDACDAADDFHPRYNAKSKTYVYIISNSAIISPFLYRYAWKIPHNLDIEKMKTASEFLKGRHDFSAFRASGCGAKNPVRTILNISIERLNAIHLFDMHLSGNFLKIRLQADAFLRHMVRNIVGTLVEIGKGKIEPEDIKKIINSKKRNLAGPTSPAKGLFLEKVFF
ncbi:tRNA pseudouridine synthase A [Dissulfurispira thermophila]|uniref:tRNA pseudouridine synthase A n=2 Tax=root TaxID=1 RepID=A0A7G1H4C0_9BACT|nr:tRNA pseudouridine(38-40) synthase TruA [Dissulfurispira thermophila]BCB96981.1 tRNA pseudouridine synthase A [Dissulfurispira thermophila]